MSHIKDKIKEIAENGNMWVDLDEHSSDLEIVLRLLDEIVFKMKDLQKQVDELQVKQDSL